MATAGCVMPVTLNAVLHALPYAATGMRNEHENDVNTDVGMDPVEIAPAVTGLVAAAGEADPRHSRVAGIVGGVADPRLATALIAEAQ